METRTWLYVRDRWGHWGIFNTPILSLVLGNSSLGDLRCVLSDECTSLTPPGEAVLVEVLLFCTAPWGCNGLNRVVSNSCSSPNSPGHQSLVAFGQDFKEVIIKVK